MSEKKVIPVLSIDGGGIRGIIPAIILRYIERRTFVKIRAKINCLESDERRESLKSELSKLIMTEGKTKYIPTSELFDMIAGTSTGGILALSLALPDERKQPRYTAAELVKFYKKDGPKIFKRSWQRIPIISFTVNLWRAKYSSKKIRDILEERFRGTKLSEALCDIIVPSYELVNRIPWFFKSRSAKDKKYKKTYDFLMSDVALATSAAPTYFKPHKIESIIVDGGEPHEGKFVDGGLYANHPAMCAFVQVKAQCPNAEIHLVSLGTGEKDPLQGLKKKKRSWGIYSWTKPVISVISDGASDTVNYQLEKLLHESKNGEYYRFQLDLSQVEEDLGLDDADDDSLEALQCHAIDLIKGKKNKLRTLCTALSDQLFNKLCDRLDHDHS